MYLINVADLKDPEDPHGRSYREVNRSKRHNIPLGSLVEVESGARLFVVVLGRDCDETPLYGLAVEPDQKPVCHGWEEESLTVVRLEGKVHGTR